VATAPPASGGQGSGARRIPLKTNHGDIWLRPSAVIGVARETTRTSAMRLVDGKVYNVAGSPKEVLDALGASFTSQAG
jgi:hypothetical protein